MKSIISAILLLFMADENFQSNTFSVFGEKTNLTSELCHHFNLGHVSLTHSRHHHHHHVVQQDHHHYHGKQQDHHHHRGLQQDHHHHHDHNEKWRPRRHKSHFDNKSEEMNPHSKADSNIFMAGIIPLDDFRTADHHEGTYHWLNRDHPDTTPSIPSNSTRPEVTGSHVPRLPKYHPISFKVVGSFFVGLIFLTGVLGNVMVVLVVVRMRSMHTPTNCYLISLAVADLLLLMFACLPTMVDFYAVQDHFLFGWVGCRIMVFAQYLSVNLSSLSMTAFTVERYVAICHPMIAHRMCTVRRANKIIICLWIFGILYCSPWLVLISVKPLTFDDGTVVETCTFNLQRSHYATYYMADLLVFYVIPLFVNSTLYVCIGRTLYGAPGSMRVRRGLIKMEESTMMEMVTSSNGGGSTSIKRRTEDNLFIKQNHHHHQQQHHHHHEHGIKITTLDGRNRIQVIKMLAVVVAMFAILWLPYRGYVVYNSFARVRFECAWCMLACRIMIYTNSAINPILYNAMSSKFRRSFLRLLLPRRHRDQNLQMKQINSTNE